MRLFLSLIAVVLIAGCTAPLSPTTTTPSTATTLSGDVHEPSTTVSGNDYTMLFDNTRQQSVTMYHTAREATTVYFTNTDATRMHVSVSTPETATGNIRRGLVIMPDGMTDGPFGTDTTYDLTQTGSYQLIFKESMMAGDPRSGKVKISVRVE